MKSPHFFLLVLLTQLVMGVSSGYSADLIDATLKDQKTVDLVVYSDNLALVREVRSVAIPKGMAKLKFSEVSGAIIPETIQVRSLTTPKDFSVWEQNYDNNTFDASRLLDKFIGKKIKIIQWNQYQDRKEVVEAILLSNNGEPIYQVGNEIYLGYQGTRVLPEVPEGFISRPALIWMLNNQSATKGQDLEVSYLTNNVGWKTDYVLVLNALEPAQISSWVTVNNHSGALYKNSKLRLLAGNVNRVQNQAYPPRAMMMKMSDAALESGGTNEFQQKSLMDYHIYELPRRVDLGINETKQLQLLKTQNIKTESEYRMETPTHLYGRYYGENQDRHPIQTVLKIVNKKENNLGVPLPGGTIRVYRRDKEGVQYFVGENSVSNVASGEEFKIAIGEAFDIIAKKKQSDFKQVTNNSYESEWEIVIKNQKDEDVEVSIFEQLSGNWKILASSLPYEKIEAFKILFKMKIPKKGESKLTYRIFVGV